MERSLFFTNPDLGLHTSLSGLGRAPVLTQLVKNNFVSAQAAKAATVIIPTQVLPPDFDEQYYLSSNPDVAAAVARNLPNGFKSGAEHYIAYGHSEGRKYKPGIIDKLIARVNSLPADFDEQFYLASNPDVAAAVARNLPNGLKSGAEHYVTYGKSEGRAYKRPAPIPVQPGNIFENPAQILTPSIPNTGINPPVINVPQVVVPQVPAEIRNSPEIMQAVQKAQEEQVKASAPGMSKNVKIGLGITGVILLGIAVWKFS